MPRLDVMKTTVDIPDEHIALTEFNRRRRLQKLAEKFGTLTDFMTQEELRQMRSCGPYPAGNGAPPISS